MSDFQEDLNLVVATTRHERFRVLCDESHEGHAGVRDWIRTKAARIRATLPNAPPAEIPIGLIPRDDRIRVGFLVPVLLWGGAEEWAKNLLLHLDPTRFAVTGLAIENEGRVHEPTFRHFRAKIPTGRGREAIQRILDTSNVVVDWGVSLEGFRIPTGIKIVGVSHGDTSSNYSPQAIGKVEPYAHEWVGVSPSASLPEGYPATILTNGADLDRLAPKRTRKEVREQLGAGHGDRVILYVGRMATEDKRVDLLIDIVAALPAPYTLWIVGDGWEAPPILQKASEAIPGRFRHIPWTEAPGDYIHAADLGILVSGTESFGLVLAEFVASGLPTLSTRVGLAKMHPELFRVVEVDESAAQIAWEIEQEFSDLERYERAERAGAIVEAEYSREAFVKRWEDYLQSIAPPAPELPGVITMAAGFAKSAAKQIAAGNPLLTDSQIETRLAICRACPQVITEPALRCGGMSGCGCWLTEKAKWGTARCPEGKWPD